VNELGRRFPQSLKGDPSTELLALAGRYTMDQEREIHRALIHADPISPHEEGLQAGIETEEKLEVSRKKETEDFGDNVELF